MHTRLYSQLGALLLLVIAATGCARLQEDVSLISTPTSSPTDAHQSTPVFDLAEYAFHDSVDPTQPYLFYLHGRIIEDQGIPAISPEYGEYEYQSILEKLGSQGFVVISEQRTKNTDSLNYAERIAGQITTLMQAGVPPRNITVVGASKGAGIAIFVSHLLENTDINYVIMAICDPATVAELERNGISLHGNVLSIYDSSDELAGSCQELFSFSEDKGISKHEEIVLHVGTGHGILYKPLDEWVTPAVHWAGKP